MYENDDNLLKITWKIYKNEIDENIKTNGYLECNLSSDGLTTNFINVGTYGVAVANVTGGSRKNNIRHKKIKTKKIKVRINIKKLIYLDY